MSKKINLYHIKKSTLAIIIILALLCVLFIVFIAQLDYEINAMSIDGIQNDEINKLITRRTISDVMVVLTSILGTNLLLSALIEKKNKNNMVTEFLVDEMLASESVYANLSEKNQNSLLRNIELRKVFDNNEVAYNMHKYMIEKMKNDLKDYYFTECEYVISVDAKENFFEKTLTHTIEVMPYAPNTTIKKFSLAKINLRNIDSLPNFEIKDVQIDGKALKIIKDGEDNFTRKSDIQMEVIPNNNKLDNKNGYDTNVSYYLNQNLHLKNNKSTKIVTNLITRCPLDDVNTTFRASVPCKKFSVNYSIVQDKEYKLAGSAFGFLDAAATFPNSDKSNTMRFGFNDWIFTDDGISITIIKR